MCLMGNYDNDKGFVDPISNAQRRIPLEVLREEPTDFDTADNIKSWRRYTATGSARNTAVFTSAKPVKSFATVRFALII